MYRLQSGHFAVEDHLEMISKKMKGFYEKQEDEGFLRQESAPRACGNDRKPRNITYDVL
jgi:hypothetical protein